MVAARMCLKFFNQQPITYHELIFPFTRRKQRIRYLRFRCRLCQGRGRHGRGPKCEGQVRANESYTENRCYYTRHLEGSGGWTAYWKPRHPILGHPWQAERRINTGENFDRVIWAYTNEADALAAIKAEKSRA